MKQARWTVALHASLFLLTAATTSAQALSKDDSKCRKFIGQKVQKITDAFLNEKRKCHEQRMRGKISAATDCNDVDDPGFPESGKKRIQKRTSALIDKIETRCAKASSPAGNGYASCAAPCDSVVPTVTTYTDVAACLSCLAANEAGDAVETAYGASPAVQGERNDLWKCQNAYLGNALRAYVKSLMSEQSSCQYKEDKGRIGATDCEAADLRGKVAKALAKFNERVARCTDTELASLDSCASTVVAEQSCLRAAGDLVADSLFNAVYPFSTSGASYRIVGTNQTSCYDNSTAIPCPTSGAPFYGQDAQYASAQPSYRDNGDGTVTDENTGLMWQQDPGSKQTYAEAVAGAAGFDLGGYADWRLPTIKELYSLILFSGEDPSGETGNDTSGLTPFIDDSVFAFEYGDTSAGQRIIDSQWATSNVYGSTVLGGQECFFGVNFADGRIKCYPTAEQPGGNGGYFTIYVRGNSEYGTNNLSANGDGTVSDAATGLMWMQDDNGEGVIWEDALAYCEDLSYAGHDDWRLPNAKELQSIVDYARAPDTTGSAAIDPLFSCTSIINEAGQTDYPFYWTSTTHVNSNGIGDTADYVSFGRAMGYWMNQWQDVHGAGAQRSDPKAGNPADYPTGHGPQGDAVHIYNYVRCVRDAAQTPG